MERKIGEIFEYNGEWYQCIEGNWCRRCDLHKPNLSASQCDNKSYCLSSKREDKTSVIFKKLEKVGEPYADYCPSGRVIYFQRYRCFQKPIYNGDFICWSDDISISIEIKQNKEDMEEKKTTFPKEDNALTRTVFAYVNGKISDKELIRSIKEMSDEYPYAKSSLKPFNLQAAKSGKPVCTRDGRKARIICFDVKSEMPIVALVESCNNVEVPIAYYNDGCIYSDEYNDDDLMMLPEKKEGWVNVSKFSTYASKEEALSHKTYDIIDTIKVSWEE